MCDWWVLPEEGIKRRLAQDRKIKIPEFAIFLPTLDYTCIFEAYSILKQAKLSIIVVDDCRLCFPHISSLLHLTKLYSLIKQTGHVMNAACFRHSVLF